MKHLVLMVVLLSACASKINEPVSALDGDGCALCHTNITNAHPKAVILCTNCHGQNTGVSAEQLAELQARFRDENPAFGSSQYVALQDAMHVAPRDPQFFLGKACFNGGITKGCTNGDDKSLGTVDDAIDSEYARDVNYVRFLNPGDLRVAHASCGGGNPQAGSFGGCHTEEVLRVRRSIMTGNSSVVTAAYIGNRGTPPTPAQTRGQVGDARGYMFDLDSVDACLQGNSFSRECLQKRAAYPDDEPVSPLMPGNDVTQFDVFPGPISAVLDRVGGAPDDNGILTGGHTMAHEGFATRLGGVGGQPLDGTNEPRAQLKQPDNLDASVLVQFSLMPVVAATSLTQAVCNDPTKMPMGALIEPVDAILRGFRAYYPLWLPGTGHNFNGVAGNTLTAASTNIHTLGTDAKEDSFAFNPFGRGHGSGCTGCHMLYENDGHSREPSDPTIGLARRQVHTGLVDGAKFEQQGMNVEPDDSTRKAERFYPARHRMTTRIPTKQCGLCHTFVTRIDLAYQGISEIEEKSTLARNDLDPTLFPNQGDIAWTTAKGTRVRIIDSLERVSGNNKDLEATFRVTTDNRWKSYRKLLVDECARRQIDCDGLALFSADFNGNGELDADEHFADGVTGGELWLPDRVPREASVDGRQVRVLYGGPNGSTHLKDVHFQKGMHCVDCHFYQDLHGDGNIYTNNWDQIEIECEDCHGFSGKRAQEVRPGSLLTSGPNGRNDLMKMTDDQRRPYFFVDANGKLFQRSRVNPEQVWEVPQVADTSAPTEAHSDKHLPTAPGDKGKLECYSCHNSFAMNCMACHYQENFNQKARQQKEVFLTGGLQGSHTNFQLFGLVRGPLILGVNGKAEQNRLSPMRSTMEAYVGLADCNGNSIANFVTHSNCRSGVPQAGTSMNNFMPHSVRTDTVRGCETCHTATNAQGHVVNNHVLAQTMGLGSGRLNLLGDWLFVASASSLDVVDVKDESELGDTSEKNSFPGFIVGKKSVTGVASVRSYAHGVGGQPQDVALVRGFNGKLCTSEKLLNADIAVVAAGTGGVQVFDASLPDLHVAAGLPNAPLASIGGGNAVAIDHAAPDLSDPFFYVADALLGLRVVDLRGIAFNPLDAGPLGQTANIAGSKALPGTLAAAGVKLMGTVAAVTGNDATDTKLVMFDVSNPASPSILGSTSLCGTMSCTSKAGRLTSQGAVVYVTLTDSASTGSLAAVDVKDPANPQFLGAVTIGAPAEDVAISGHLAFVAAGTAGLVVVDVTDPAAMQKIAVQPSLGAGKKAHGVVVAAIPTQTWAFVAADTDGVLAVNVSTLFDPYRGRAGQPPAVVAPDHVSLTLESRDPFSPRDTTVATDSMPVIAFPTTTAARRIARGIQLDRLVDESGRRIRDQWNPGSGVLSRALMDNLRAQSYPYQP